MLVASDMEHLILAKSQGRFIFTQDDDFLRLNDKGVNHTDIVYARQQMPIGDIKSQKNFIINAQSGFKKTKVSVVFLELSVLIFHSTLFKK